MTTTLRGMTPDQIARQYARDVMATGSSNHSYDFLFGTGSLGYAPGHSSDPIGMAVENVAKIVGTKVRWGLESRGATFGGEITEDVVYQAFLPVFTTLEKRKSET